ncbi:FAD-dependent oxidoreductase [Christensenellaceae bacterium OttesenSCG-928-K19]|nr:FAD-dependent oxidoreductase [Christensenellaceae bacterium OttesenSCG-928-K19]
MSMDAPKLQALANSCLSGEQPPCACACPLGVDVKLLVEKIKSGSIAAAYRMYTNCTVFPGIVSHTCTQPCSSQCIRSGLDGSVQIRGLEQFCWEQSHGKSKSAYFIPPKDKQVLVVGGGLTGLSCAVKLAQRGYSVRLLEKENRVGGKLWQVDESVLPRAILEEELAALAALKYLQIETNTPVADLSGLSFDVAVIATGDSVADLSGCDGRVLFPPDVSEPKDAIHAIRRGVHLSYAAESIIKVDADKTTYETVSGCAFHPTVNDMERAEPIVPKGRYYDVEEAAQEAERCLLCECKNCIDVCDMLASFRKDAKKTLVDVSNTLYTTQITTKAALRQILSCTQCGLCKPACPVGIDFRHIFAESRRIMHKNGQLPDALYDFWIQDMLFSNGEAALVPGNAGNDVRYLYFPGCQMGASDPAYVEESYAWLERAFPGQVQLMLYCCGAPANWAGDEEKQQKALDGIRDAWQRLGKPQVILACPNCAVQFAEYLPDIPVLSLWGLMARQPWPEPQGEQDVISVFDPCASKGDPASQQAIRSLVQARGYDVEELPHSGAQARCCGYGGLVRSGNPGLEKQMQQKNIGESGRDYVTYCTNCRDSFVLHGKSALHILDVLFFDAQARKLRQPPSLTERRANRLALRQSLGGQSAVSGAKPYDGIKLAIPPELVEKMNNELIHEENIKQVIFQCEADGMLLYNAEDDTYTCHQLQSLTTYWVRFQKADGEYRLVNMYKHRMQIEE